MQHEIGILDLQYLIQPGTEPQWFQGISQYLPKDIEVLNDKSGLAVLDFIENHKRIIVLNPETSLVGVPMIYGEVAYWGQFTGSMPEEIIVLGTHSQEGELVAAEVLKCLDSVV